MSHKVKRIVYVLIVLLLIGQPSLLNYCLASPSSAFQEEAGGIFDDWHVYRTNPAGLDGYLQEIYTSNEWPPANFRPLIVFESLGEYVDVAYSEGERIARQIPDISQRAEYVFRFVQLSIQYTSDSEQFKMGEYAQNADEVTRDILNNGIAFGDCEEFATTLAVMFLGAGLRAAIVDCPDHVGVVVYLPGYNKANVIFEIDGEAGWVWAEATGSGNKLGWFPEGQIQGPLLVYEVTAEPLTLWQEPVEEEVVSDDQPESTDKPEVIDENGPVPPPVSHAGPSFVSLLIPMIIMGGLIGFFVVLKVMKRKPRGL